MTLVIFFIILTFSFALFFGGHYTPGGGFVGGLMTAAALILIIIAYDMKTLKEAVSIDFKKLLNVGLIFAIGMPFVSMLFGKNFFQHFHTYIDIPVFGKTSLHTAVLFDLGVYLIVVSVTLIIILTIGENE